MLTYEARDTRVCMTTKNKTFAQLEQVFQRHLLRDILECTSQNTKESSHGTECSQGATHRVRDHLGKLFETELTISVLISLHYSLVDDLL